ncbi:HupE/UreJ family protein [Microcystis aeruginosa]|uniref:HupE/UreJ family protein n=1 Tax=Microcystis aeruginosa TaxID=1126 RepID=UPI00077698AE|nr:HupE/UreJ family protein [Microcystis aeruginosa]KXS89446.1 urease accessory protein UreJ [Microcystis aeruginosa NIES-88]BCU11876.1 urease accessory protein UreJ [Microcystis aeruginosa]
MKIIFRQSWTKILTIVPLLLLIFASKTLAHHAMAGQTPDNFWNGFLSGLAHPVIGLDHLAFVVASGLIAVGMEQGLLIPLAFAITTLIGTGIHLQGINLLFPEGIVALSVVIFGVVLTLKKGLQTHSNLYTIALATLAMIAGIFHGYAYGESIIGARVAALVAYLIGFTVIQLAIASGAFFLGSVIKEKLAKQATLISKLIGLAIMAIGTTFLVGIK